MLHHQKAADGAGKLHRGLTAHFPEPGDFDDWHFLTQVNQARAIALGVEHLRANRDVCSGAVVWQLNDCWPVTSWAAVDGDGRRKPLWYALRRAFADRLVTVQPDGDGLRGVVVVDGLEGWSGTLTACRVRLDGTVLAEEQHSFEVAAGSAASWPLPASLATPDDAANELLVVAADGLRSWWTWGRDRDLRYPQAQYHSSVAHTPDGSQVTVIADSFLRDLSLLVDRTHHDAEVDDMLVTLLPGESHTFDVTGVAGLDPTQLTTRPVLRVVNDIADFHGDASHAGS
jgi:beta-mannosidase